MYSSVKELLEAAEDKGVLRIRKSVPGDYTTMHVANEGDKRLAKFILDNWNRNLQKEWDTKYEPDDWQYLLVMIFDRFFESELSLDQQKKFAKIDPFSFLNLIHLYLFNDFTYQISVSALEIALKKLKRLPRIKYPVKNFYEMTQRNLIKIQEMEADKGIVIFV